MAQYFETLIGRQSFYGEGMTPPYFASDWLVAFIG